MRIGIDLDGCVYDWVTAFRNYLIGQGRAIGDMDEPTRYNFWPDWGLTDAEFCLYKEHGEAAGVCHKGQAYPGAVEALNELRLLGHSLHIITHRLGPHAQTSTIGWLADNEVGYDTITFTADKSGYPVDICIEDQVENARAIEGSGVTCVLMDRSWNRSDEATGLMRVKSWSEFVRLCDADQGWRQLKATGEITTAEVRTVSPTGGEKGSKPEQYSMIPVPALAEVARVYEYGSRKYDRDNWRRGYHWHLSYDALQRHLNAFWSGQDFDPESGLHHLAHATFHAFALFTFGGDLERYAQYDDRHRDVPG